MIGDSNSAIGFTTNLLGGITSGDMLLLGILLFGGVMIALMLARVKASTAVMVGVAMAFMLAFVAGAFMVLFWIALIISIFVLMNGIRKWITGQ